MQPIKPRYQPRGKFRIPTPKPMKQGSLVRDYPYVALVSLVLLAILVALLFAKTLGMKAYDAFVVGAWVGSIPFFVWQLWRYMKHRANPEAAAKQEAARKAEAEAKAKAARVAAEKAAARAGSAAKPKIAVVPRAPAQRVPIRKPGMNVKPQQPNEPPPQTDQSSKT